MAINDLQQLGRLRQTFDKSDDLNTLHIRTWDGTTLLDEYVLTGASFRTPEAVNTLAEYLLAKVITGDSGGGGGGSVPVVLSTGDGSITFES